MLRVGIPLTLSCEPQDGQNSLESVASREQAGQVNGSTISLHRAAHNATVQIARPSGCCCRPRWSRFTATMSHRQRHSFLLGATARR
jgi:hypothetical protein